MGDASLKELGREQYVSLGTFRRDGREVKTPVCDCHLLRMKT